MSYSEEQGKKIIEELFDKSVIPSLSQFITIPNLSRSYDQQYKTNGLLQKAGLHLKTWMEGLGLNNLKAELLESNDLSPFLFAEIEGEIKDHTFVFYGHFDKEPWSSGWDQNKGPTKPVIENDRLYGRGGVDDGYSLYSSVLAIHALQQQKVPLPRILFLMESDKESGMHIDIWMQKLKERIGSVDLVVILDADIGDYQRFWLCKSIRGYVNFNIKIKILKDGVHSGQASGIVPSTFKIANQLLSRLQNVNTGELIDYFQRDIPSDRYDQFYQTARDTGIKQFSHLKLVPGIKFQSSNTLQTLLRRGWKPVLTVKGLSGFPPVQSAGNLMLPEISISVRIRVPPTFRQKQGENKIHQLLTKNTPFNSTVQLSEYEVAEGWNSAPYEPWLEDIIQNSSKDIFGAKAYSTAEGAGIPVIDCFVRNCPKASFLVTGALGPEANGHGPNEFLDISYAKKLTRMIALVVGRSSHHYCPPK